MYLHYKSATKLTGFRHSSILVCLTLIFLVACDSRPPYLIKDGLMDEPGLLTKQEETDLRRLLVGLPEKCECKVFIAIVRSLNGKKVEERAAEVAEQRNLNSADNYRTAMIFISSDEGEYRIQVRDGLEATFSDNDLDEIMNDIMIPAFSSSQYASGLKKATIRISEIASRTRQ